MDLKFYKGATRPSGIPTGSLWFNTAKKRIELITSSSASEIYGSNVADVTKTGNTLTITKIDGSTVTITDTDSKVTSVGNHYTPSSGTATTGVIINSITKDAAGHITAIGTASGLSADKITSGTIDIARLPKGALERLFVVATEAAAMAADVQEGDTVKVTGNSNKMYFCVSDPKATGATFATCFTEYTAGSATSVPWSGVTGKPTSYTPSAHNHDDRYYTETEMNSKLSAKVDATTAGINSAINLLSVGTSTPEDADYYISQYVGGGTTTTTYHRRPISELFNYVKGKLATVANSGSYNDLSNKPTSLPASDVYAWAKASTKPSYTWDEITEKPTTFTPASHSHFNLTPEGDSRKIASNPNDYSNTFKFVGIKNSASIGSPSSKTYSYLFGLRGWDDNSGGGSHELAFNDKGIFWRKEKYKTTSDGTWEDWKPILTGGSQTTTSSADGGSNVYTFSDGSTITVKNGTKGSKGDQGESGEKGDTGVRALQPAKTFTSTYSTIGATASMAFTDFNRTPEVGDTFINMDGAGNMGTWQITAVTTNTATFKLLTNKNIKGVTGAAAGFGTPTASITNTTGTPSVTVTSSGDNTAKVFNFAFSGLKGEKGDPGESGNDTLIIPITGTSYSNLKVLDYVTLKNAWDAQTPVYLASPNTWFYLGGYSSSSGSATFIFPHGSNSSRYLKVIFNYSNSTWVISSLSGAYNYGYLTSAVTSLGGKAGAITLGTGLSIDSSNVLSVTSGAAGADGTSAEWFTGTAVTGTSTSGVTVSVSGSKKGDMYLNTSTANVYLATAANTWVYKCNIKGATGSAGTPGKDGTSVSVRSTSESSVSGGTNTVTFSDGKTLSIKNGKDGKDGTFDANAYPVEEWKFTLDDGTTTSKYIVTKNQ